MAKNLSGKTVLITGASSGIGRSTAFEFARASPSSLKLVLTARRLDRLEEIKQKIHEEMGPGVEVLVKHFDVSKPDGAETLVEELPYGFRDIDILVNNAYEIRLP